MEYTMIPFAIRPGIRATLLNIFLTHPSRNWHLRELARIVHTSAGNTQKELRKLESAQIIRSEMKGSIRQFSMNSSFRFRDELRSIVNQTVGIEYILRTHLQNLHGIRFAFIFGSYVKGGFRNDSDVDLFVIGDIDEDELISYIRKAEEMTQREINFHITNIDEFQESLKKKSFYQDIIQNYSLIYGQESEFTKIIGATLERREVEKTTIQK